MRFIYKSKYLVYGGKSVGLFSVDGTKFSDRKVWFKNSLTQNDFVPHALACATVNTQVTELSKNLILGGKNFENLTMPFDGASLL